MSDFFHYDSSLNSQDMMTFPQYLFSAGGESVFPKDGPYVASNTALASQELGLVGFIAKRTEPITRISIFTGGTAAAATPSIGRYGVYQRNGDGSITLLAATANDVNLFNATNSEFIKTLTTTFNKVKGVEYCIGQLVVSGVAMPTLNTPTTAWSAPFQTRVNIVRPLVQAKVTGQADLGAIGSSIAAASIVVSASAFHALMLP